MVYNDTTRTLLKWLAQPAMSGGDCAYSMSIVAKATSKTVTTHMKAAEKRGHVYVSDRVQHGTRKKWYTISKEGRQYVETLDREGVRRWT